MADISFIAQYGPVAFDMSVTHNHAHQRPDVKVTYLFSSEDKEKAIVTLSRLSLAEHWTPRDPYLSLALARIIQPDNTSHHVL